MGAGRKVKTVKKNGLSERGSGVLLHLTSLPGGYGVGDLGPAATAFVDFLAAAGQRCWQFLPVGPVDMAAGGSPYMSPAALAGNPLLISLDLMLADGLLNRAELAGKPDFSEYQVHFPAVRAAKSALLRRAWGRLPGQSRLRDEFISFGAAEADWLRDYALFAAIREQFHGAPWWEWPPALARRQEAALAEAEASLGERIAYYQFEQFLFFRQWRRLRDHARRQGVGLIGDLPIYVSLDSVDVWAHQTIFQLDPRSLRPTHVAGVPPDYFSKTGQRWGNPLYRWSEGEGGGLYAWWRRRFKQLGRLVDVARIDHFRGFAAYWRVPAREATAVNGRWVRGPGRRFFAAMREAIGDLAIIAEDLGVITPEVVRLREELGFPGMKILQFAFDSDAANLYLPHNFGHDNWVVFTGTHDNNTTLGWYLEEAGEEARRRLRRYAHSEAREAHWDLIRLALSSTARTAIIPMQDLLGFGADCRMNRPGTVTGNWGWRCAERFLTGELAQRLREETEFYGRGR